MDSVGKHRSPWRQLWLQHQYTIICWGAALVSLFFLYHLFSDGDFSFLMTLGSSFVLFGFGLLVAKVVQTRSVSNISLKTLEASALAYAARLTSILTYEGYLPYDRSGDGFYQATEVLALVMVVGLIVCVVGVYPATYSAGRDAFVLDVVPGVRLPTEVRVLQLAAPALLLAAVFHPNLNNNWFTDTAWAFALYLEAVAMLPQVLLFKRMQDSRIEMEHWESNFVFSIAIARVLHAVFWASSFRELNDRHGASLTRAFPGHLVVMAQLVGLVVLAEFIIQYMTKARRQTILVF